MPKFVIDVLSDHKGLTNQQTLVFTTLNVFLHLRLYQIDSKPSVSESVNINEINAGTEFLLSGVHSGWSKLTYRSLEYK
jgi:hypothetical protein